MSENFAGFLNYFVEFFIIKVVIENLLCLVVFSSQCWEVEVVSVSVEVSPNILNWIQHQISSQIDTKISSLLNKWINHEEIPNTNTILTVSKATNIPFGYFFLKNPPQDECSLIHCRTINSLKNKNFSRDLIDTYNTMTNIQNWMSDYNRENLGIDSLSFVGRCKEKNSVVDIANDIRQELEITTDEFKKVKKKSNYFKYLKEKITELGILVMKNSCVGNNHNRKLNIEEFRAFTLIDDYAPLIFINNNDSENGKIFSLIHELAHIWLGENNLFNDNYFSSSVSKTEQICNAVAAEILVPIDYFKTEWNNLASDSIDKISELADVFHCSKLVIARRALDLKFISKEIYADVLNEVQEDFRRFKNQKKSSGSGGNFYNTLQTYWDKNFILALDGSTKSGKTSYLDAYRLTGLKGNTFHKLINFFE